MSQTKKVLHSKKNLILAGLVIVLLITGAFIYKNHDSSSENNTTLTPEGLINLNSPSQDEINDTEAHKESLVKQGQQTPSSNGLIQATPVITSANQNEVRGFVSGVVEDDGDCIATFKQGSNSFTAQSKGMMDATTTICTPINLSRDKFSAPGEWTLTLVYTSTKAKGESQPIKIEVK